MDQGDSRELIPQPQPGELIRRTPQEADEIRREIEESRRQIASSLNQLRSEVSTTVERALDWRGWVQDHPTSAVGIAFGIGLYFGLR